MSAIVAILNKQGVALAADSAETISNMEAPNGAKKNKIFNGANKIFTLSKCHPVGVMVYNHATFMGTPWETIIKMYRKQLGDKSFGTVKLYQEDFINFLIQKNYYADKLTQENNLISLIYFVLNSVISTVVGTDDRFKKPNESPELSIEYVNAIQNKINEFTVIWNIEDKFCAHLKALSFEDYKAISRAIFDFAIDGTFTKYGIVVDGIKNEIEFLTYLIFKAKESFINFTGLIFVGFGEDEIFPNLIPINISLGINTLLRYSVVDYDCVSISNTNQSAVKPFGQIDVILTILTGIDQSLGNTFTENFKASFKKYNSELLKLIGDGNPDLSEKIRNLDVDVLVNEFQQKNTEVTSSQYVDPMFKAVNHLSKLDLAEMAESLIFLTYLKRRITDTEESVGGPVDVAVISKGDGFIWIKRKLYFEPKLNQYFFDNYFKQ